MRRSNLAIIHETLHSHMKPCWGGIYIGILRPTPSLWCVAIGGDLGPFLIAPRSRFDGLIIHKLRYYKSYNMNALLDFIRSTSMRSKWSTQGIAQWEPYIWIRQAAGLSRNDTTSYIGLLYCSSSWDISLIDQYPETFWSWKMHGGGCHHWCIPFGGSAPNEIIQLLVNSYLSHHPNHQFNWNMMVLTLGWINAHSEPA
jgi:hypothetical protein